MFLLSFKSFLTFSGGNEHAGKVFSQIVYSVEGCCRAAAILGNSIYLGCHGGQRCDGIGSKVPAFHQSAVVQKCGGYLT